MIVYILSEGDDYEGGSTLGVFLSPESAKAFADERNGSHRETKWGKWGASVGRTKYMSSRHDPGCTWKQIEEWEVTE